MVWHAQSLLRDTRVYGFRSAACEYGSEIIYPVFPRAVALVYDGIQVASPRRDYFLVFFWRCRSLLPSGQSR